MEEDVQRNPPRPGHLGVEGEGRPLIQRENVGTDRDGREDRSPGHDIIEGADQVLAAEGEPDLLGGLPHGGGEKVRVSGLLPAPGQGHMAGPGVACTLGAANEQQGVGIGGEDNGDRRPDEGIATVVHHRAVDGEPIAKAVKPGGQWL